MLQQEIRYLVRMEPGVQTPEETFASGCGSCRDSGWLLVQILRHLGIAARFASGYLIQLVADVKPLDGPAGPERDFTDLHAWAEAYLPGAGWIGFDPTSGLLAGEGHLPLACTADPGNAAPVIGYTDRCNVEFEFEMHVTRIHEDPRVTRPYSEPQWKAIDVLGEAVDAELVRHDVRLTQGGEPTFVSIDDMEGPEWNYTALSPRKRELAEQLLARLAQRFAPGGLWHDAQGKWYPGEPLPRWALGVFWRPDGQPLWRDPTRFADTTRPGTASVEDARRFGEALATRLGLPPDKVITAYEDVPALLRDEAALPANADPLKADLSKPGERARLAKLLLAGLDKPAGYVLPLKPDDEDATADITWVTSPWPLRRERLYALAGDSPLGLRLPLGSLPEIAAVDEQLDPPADPFAPRAGLPAREALRAAGRGRVSPAVVKTALCLEARGGHLRVFLPPVARLEAFAVLAAAIEDTAVALDARVTIEGYPPPRDPRVSVLAVTPDPGVIEVNIHPARTWKDLVRNTEVLYEEARLARLGTEKFMLDGRHTGTGGGNHVTLGGPTPADSPLLRRPDLLRSLITYWQNHPSLSYLFSGTVHRTDEPGPARGRGARRQALRAGDRVPADGAQARRRHRGPPAVAGRPAAAPPAHRPHRQYAPRRVLHRQAVLARRRHRAPGSARVPRLRDAAALPDECGPDAAAAGAGRALLARALLRSAGALGHRAARPLAAAAFRGPRHRRCRRRPRPQRLPVRARVVRSLRRVPLSPLRHGEL